jgi:WD40 repeat protein
LSPHQPAAVGGLGCALALAAVVVALVSPARADVIATLDGSVLGPSGVHVINATTGVGLPPPAGVNDPAADEFHPSLSPDGRYLVFERRLSGTVRIVMVERATGRSADLFNAFEAASDPPSTPTFSPDGTKVLTGRRLDRRDAASPAGALQSSFTETDVTNFPTGPFPHRVIPAGGPDSTAAGRTVQPAPFGSNLLAFGIDFASGGPPGRITVQGPTGATTISDSTLRLAKPTVSEPAGAVVFESARAATPFATKLVFRPLAGIAAAATTELPAPVNASGTSVRDPTFTRDGRYLVFARLEAAAGKSFARLFIWDTQTQLFVNPTGSGRLPAPDFTDGAIALESRRVLTTNTVLASGSLSFSLASGSTIGLLVQHIVGRHKLLGRTAPRLRNAGRVPLGTFRKGRHRKHWNFTVRGHELRSGCYLVTFRALTNKRQVRDLSTPYTVRIGEHQRPLVRKGVRLRSCRRASISDR